MTCVSSWQDDLHSQLGTEHLASIRLQIWKHTLASAMLCSPKNTVHILGKKQNLSVFYTGCLEQHIILRSFTIFLSFTKVVLNNTSFTVALCISVNTYIWTSARTWACTLEDGSILAAAKLRLGQKEKKNEKNWNQKMRQGSGERWMTGDRTPTGWQRCFGSHFPFQLHHTQDLLLLRQQLRLGNNSTLNISSNSEVNQPSECLRTHLGEGGKLVESFDEAEEL